MDEFEIITSSENLTIKKIKKLKTKKYREKEKLFIAEGYKFLDFKYEPKIIIISEEIKENYKILNKIKEKNCRKIIVSEKIFKTLSSQENSQGVIVIYPFKDGNLNLNKDIIVLDKIQDPGNLGTIIRVAAASGIKDIIMSVGTCDIYNEKTVRSSMGSIFDMNIIYLNEDEIIRILKEKGYKLLVTALDENAISYIDMKLDSFNALVFGSEGNGVSKKFLENADSKIIIPIYGMAESLNVAMASGIMMYKLRELRGCRK